MNVIKNIASRISWGYSMFSLNGIYYIFTIIGILYLIWVFFGNKVKSTVDEYSQTFEDIIEQFKKENLIKPHEVIKLNNTSQNSNINNKSDINNNSNKQDETIELYNSNSNNIKNIEQNSSRRIVDNQNVNYENNKNKKKYYDYVKNFEPQHNNYQSQQNFNANENNYKSHNNLNVNGILIEEHERYMNNFIQKPKQKLCYEDECQRIIEELTGKKFYRNVRPPFLKNPITSRNLELDCYDGEHIALEYQGIQHYKYPNPYHKSEKEFEYQVQKDKWKFEKCEENNVFLIRVPYTIPFKKLKSYIKSRLAMYYEEKSEVDRTSCYA